MIHSTKTITFSSYLSMFFLGISSTLIGAAARKIGLAPDQIGLLIATQNVGFMVAVLISGALADSYEKPRLLFVGSAVLALALFAFYRIEIFWINLLIMGFIGAGIGVYEGVTDAMLLDIHHERQNYYINVNHFFVTFGSIVIALYQLFLTGAWRNAVVQSSAIVAVLALVFAFTRLPNHARTAEPYSARLRILTREPVIAALFVATMVVAGVEMSTGGLLTTFLTVQRGLPMGWAQAALVIFLVGVATGRLLVGYFSRNEQVPQNILILFVLSTAVFAALYLLDIGFGAIVLVYLAGLSISALLPLILTLAGLMYPHMAGAVLGAIKVAIAIGGIITPLLLSIVTSRVSFQAALILMPLSFVLALLVLFPIVRGARLPDAEPPSSSAGAS